MTSIELQISFGQLSVFWKELERPFNDWTDTHVAQGFAWRAGSVSFATLVEAGVHRVEIHVVKAPPTVSRDAVRVIETPFEVPSNGAIEVASISDSAPITLPPGLYQLRCEFHLCETRDKSLVSLIFSRNASPKFAVTKADAQLSPGESLLADAKPAT